MVDMLTGASGQNAGSYICVCVRVCEREAEARWYIDKSVGACVSRIFTRARVRARKARRKFERRGSERESRIGYRYKYSVETEGRAL